jgi:hypothetical protein
MQISRSDTKTMPGSLPSAVFEKLNDLSEQELSQQGRMAYKLLTAYLKFSDKEQLQSPKRYKLLKRLFQSFSKESGSFLIYSIKIVFKKN